MMDADKINRVIHGVTHDYLLITMAAIIFFAAKSFAGYLTFRKIMKEFNEVKNLIRQDRQHAKGRPE